MSDYTSFNLNNTITESILLNSEVNIKDTKISDVPEDERIELDENTIFRFSIKILADRICFELTEIGAFCPFKYISNLSFSQMIQVHKMFKSCNDLNEIQDHILRLFAKKKMRLTKEKEDKITLNITAEYISDVVEIQIETNRVMTQEKDKGLMKLYYIQKDGIIALKEIQNELKKKGDKDLLKKVEQIIKKYDA